MTNFKGDKIFKSSAFEPTKEEVKEHKRKRREARKAAARARREPQSIFDIDDSDIEIEDAPPKRAFEDIVLDDSDDEFPDLDMISQRPTKKRKSDEGVQVSVGRRDEEWDRWRERLLMNGFAGHLLEVQEEGLGR